MTRHCYRCGWTYPRNEQPGRSETCPQCRSDLRVCLNCTHFDRRAAQQCREKRAEPVHDKELGTYCEYFDLHKRVWAGIATDAASSNRESSARDALKKLLGD